MKTTFDYIDKENVDMMLSASICELKYATVIPMMLGSKPDEIKGGVMHSSMELKFHQYRGAAVNKKQQSLDLVTDLGFISSKSRCYLSLKGTFLYGGPIFNNFGHFLAECIHRCWALDYAESQLGVKIDKVLFTPQVNPSFSFFYSKIYHLPPVYLEVLNYLGIPKHKIRCVFSPKTYEKLIVPQQASFFRAKQPVSKTYLNFLDRCEAKNVNSIKQRLYKKVYVSRKYFALRGAFAGECYIEDFLIKNGFHIFYPEQHSILTQLNMYKGAQEIIFAEGAALHILELFGHVNAHISVLCRRRLCPEVFHSILSPRVKFLTFMAEVETLPSLFFPDNSKKAAHGSALSILDTQSLLTFLERTHHLSIELFEQNKYLASVKQDLNRYLTYYMSKINKGESKKLEAVKRFKVVMDKYSL
ncbi:DUF563 domain-containing protein [Paraglaciecola sp. L3A3]|uniref:glycosyltransferase family 61 protein n=1 Tax=Paraglaciecola sp. L3A3 TaxID=2686358 RepID=UPI00131B3085|nr:glycosyltransferase 61 family protein [Paraglaciecola sp. L3A3]